MAAYRADTSLPIRLSAVALGSALAVCSGVGAGVASGVGVGVASGVASGVGVGVVGTAAGGHGQQQGRGEGQQQDGLALFHGSFPLFSGFGIYDWTVQAVTVSVPS